MTEGYEALRAQATGSRNASPRGLALLLSSGLPAWLAAWRSLVRAAPAPPPVRLPKEPAATFRLGPELAVLLAEMVLSGQRSCLS
jgi:hypothetical protein